MQNNFVAASSTAQADLKVGRTYWLAIKTGAVVYGRCKVMGAETGFLVSTDTPSNGIRAHFLCLSDVTHIQLIEQPIHPNDPALQLSKEAQKPAEEQSARALLEMIERYGDARVGEARSDWVGSKWIGPSSTGLLNRIQHALTDWGADLIENIMTDGFDHENQPRDRDRG